MKINKQLFEDVLSGKLKGTFVLGNGDTYFSDGLCRNYNKFRFTHPYIIGFGSYTSNGIYSVYGESKFDIIDFIPETYMKENELTIEIPDGKTVDWEESKKQNKIVLKDKQLTYKDVCAALYKDKIVYYTDTNGDINNMPFSEMTEDTPYDSNNASIKHQLECILAKNKLANVAVYLNDGWKPDSHINFNWGYFICVCNEDLEINARDGYKFNNNIIFETKELAQQAIEILGKETVKLALEPLGI